ncbi:hypothetical protein [Breznakiella homolactica]|uniref:Uncharacterized protein n=1 Tax=Breznakiella homolactica TaxID=2798577 RepID=A0A7T7XPA2_9SPIR|nr:hypothetical protein [Breznakiella homolactica]QQO09968.1 hypothetical protein JFL75_03375 [Breznakiella homolactica]
MIMSKIRNCILCLTAGFLLLAMSSCTATPKVFYTFDDALPQSETTSLVLPLTDISVTSYNGITVDWSTGLSLMGKFGEIVIPAGETHITFDLHYMRSGGYISTSILGGDLELQYNFEAGKKYFIYYPNGGEYLDIYLLERDEKITSKVLKRDHVSIKIGDMQ